ncbi:MAG: glycosyltransferase family 2 protein [Alphaproteobacteria bacterium]|nr:glycosyltransferase family 2 protein [Alphaproteobacteria bacterium]
MTLSNSMPRPTDPHLSVVIPVMNEVENLPSLVSALTNVLDRLPTRWELIFVDDGSEDTTFTVLSELGARNPNIKTVRFSRRFGKEIALSAGLMYALGDAVVTMDGDLQHPPETLIEFFSKWHDGVDVVYGMRRSRGTQNILQRIMRRAFYKLYNTISTTRIPEGAGDFCMLDRKVVDAFNRLRERDRFMKGLFAWVGFRQEPVLFDVQPRKHGRSGWGFWRLWRFAMTGITSFTGLPLTIWSYLGAFVALLSFLYAVVVIVRTVIFGNPVPGYTTIVVLILLFGSVQIISVGLLGEYITRIFNEVKMRPMYLVSDTVNITAQAAESQSRIVSHG